MQSNKKTKELSVGTLAHLEEQGKAAQYRNECGKCGATRTDSQVGLEATPDEYVARLVDVFREVRRVLRDDGTCWINLGDSYAAGKAGRTDHGTDDPTSRLGPLRAGLPNGSQPGPVVPRKAPDGFKPKDLLGIPWLVAFALRADGWVLRQEVIWKKPNPMPESVTDRCTKSHEQIFMFSKAKWNGLEPGEFAHISEQDARWLALFFDAEGCLALRRERDGARHAAQISLGSTSRPLLEAAQRIVGAGNILERPGQNAPMLYWQLSNKRARDLLLRLYPHLIVKQRQARCLIDLESRKWYRGDNRKGLAAAELAYRERLWEAVKSLNSFGTPDLGWVPEPKIGRWAAGPRYFYDADAIREEPAEPFRASKGPFGAGYRESQLQAQNGSENLERTQNEAGRNKRSVWTVATQPFPGAHFAVFPPKLIEPCVKAGSAEDACGVCGAPWERVVERTAIRDLWDGGPRDGGKLAGRQEQGLTSKRTGLSASNSHNDSTPQSPEVRTLGFESSCDHQDKTGSSVVLDPFSGAGTTGLVATRLGRSFIGIELNPTYAEMSRERIRDDAPLMNYLIEAT